MKTIERVGIDAMAAEAGIDLWKLPFEDARPERLAYLAENKGKVPVVSGNGCIVIRAKNGSTGCRIYVPNPTSPRGMHSL
jgi:hypothetical protein